LLNLSSSHKSWGPWLTPLSAIFQLYHGDQFQWWRKPEYPERTTDPGKATGKLYHLRLLQHYVIKFVSDLLQVGGFFGILRFRPPIKLTTMILLKYCWKWR
jgi:hypothetical protein